MAESKNLTIVPPKRRHPRGSREIEYVLDLYKAEHPDEAHKPLAPEKVAQWADDRQLLQRPIIDPVDILRKRIVSHLGHAYQIDPQGREVRANAVILEPVVTPSGIRRRSRWLPLFDAPEEFAHEFFQWRRRGALADIVQLATDRDSYNDNNIHGATLKQISFDFTADVEERNMPTSYPSSAPEGHDDEDDEI